MDNLAPYTKFNKTCMIPIRVYIDGVLIPHLEEWEEELWIERPEDWYAFLNSRYRRKKVRVVERQDWLKADAYNSNKEDI